MPLWWLSQPKHKSQIIGNSRVRHGARSPWPFLILAGLVFAADLALWHRAVVLVGAGVATVLANTQVFYLTLFGVVFFRERPGWLFYLSLPIAFCGVVMLVGLLDLGQASPEYWEGVMCGVATGVVYATYILSLRRAESLAPDLNLRFKMTMVSLISAAGLALIATLEQSMTIPNTAADWVYLWVLAAVAQVAGWLLITKNLPAVSVSRAGLIILTQPALATLLGVILLAERLSNLQWAGVCLTLLAVYVSGLKNRPAPILSSSS